MIKDKLLKDIRDERINLEKELAEKGVAFEEFLLKIQEKYQDQIEQPKKSATIKRNSG